MGCTVVFTCGCTSGFVYRKGNLISFFKHSGCDNTYMTDLSALKFDCIFYFEYAVSESNDTLIAFLTAACSVEWCLFGKDRTVLSVNECFHDF